MPRSVLGEELVTIASKSGVQGFQTNTATLFAGAGVNIRLADNLAATGEDQATALPLAAAINRITSASPEAGVNLPEAALGAVVVVINDAGDPIVVYPARGDDVSINGAEAGDGLLLPAATLSIFFCTGAGWLGVLASLTKVNARVEDQMAELNLRLDRIERLIVSSPAV